MLWQTPVQSLAELARSFRASWTGMVLLAPFEVFSHAILAGDLFPDLVCWGAAALAIDLGLLVLIFKLDADYLEAAAAISQKVYETVAAMKQGGGMALPASQNAAQIRAPPVSLAGRGRAARVAADSAGDAHVQVCPDHLDLWHRRRACASWRSFVPSETQRPAISYRSWASGSWRT